jgi:predicted negative regulator of RcsB-dependent stress response
VILIAYKSWNYYQSEQSMQASAKYDQLVKLNATDVNNLKPIQSISGELMDKFSGTPYAGRAAIAAAKANFAANEAKSARAQLEWAAGHAKEEAVKAIALLQIATVQFQDKDYQAALKTLDKSHAEGFDGLFLDLKGDVLMSLGKSDEAKKAYQEALTKLDAEGRYHQYTLHKLEALGS